MKKKREKKGPAFPFDPGRTIRRVVEKEMKIIL